MVGSEDTPLSQYYVVQFNKVIKSKHYNIYTSYTQIILSLWHFQDTFIYNALHAF